MALQGFYQKNTGRLGESVIGVNQDIINFSGSGDQTVLPAIAGRKIQVLFIVFILGGASNITLKSGSNTLSGQMNFAANQGMIIDGTDVDIETNIGEAFIINSSSVVQVGGWVKWRPN